MAKSILSAAHFRNEVAAFAYVEAKLWPNGPVCPHCGSFGDKVGKLNGKTTRLGLHKCYQAGCRKPFTVRMGTIFESSHLPLHLWLQVIHLMCASKKGIATRQIQRMLQCSMKTAWFLGHRIREAMSDGGAILPPMGGNGGNVEVDETYVGFRRGVPIRAGRGHKNAVVSLVERDGGVRSFHVRNVTVSNLWPILASHISLDTNLHTDEASFYRQIGEIFKGHFTVNHKVEEYARGDVTTNRVEGYSSVLKRGLNGIYQNVSEAHLKRYLWEFDFRFTNRSALGCEDVERADRLLTGVVGKRLTYETTAARRHSQSIPL
jgi:transposase-like protein